jgi:hypothetical protein
MRDKLNCPNCGAPLDGDKCAFCGTTFYDFSSIEDGKPCYMRIRTNQFYHDGKNVTTLITMKAIPKIEDINSTTETVACNDYMGRKMFSVVSNRSLNMGVSFMGVASDDGTLMQMEEDK